MASCLRIDDMGAIKSCLRTFVKHTFNRRAYDRTMLSYGQRLAHALELAGRSKSDLARSLGVAAQSIGQVISGASKALSAENHSRAARVLNVDDLWLATGEGEPPRQYIPKWPFSPALHARIAALTPADAGYLEGRLVSAIEERESTTLENLGVYKRKTNSQIGSGSGKNALRPVVGAGLDKVLVRSSNEDHQPKGGTKRRTGSRA